MKRIIAVVFVLMLIACLCGCRALEEEYLAGMASTGAEADPPLESAPISTPNDADASDDGGQYINTEFGFSATLPEGWFVANDEQLAQLYSQTQANVESVTGATLNSKFLFVCSQYQISNYNPTILIEALNQQEIDIEAQQAYLKNMFSELYAVKGVESVDVTATPSCTINDTQYLLLSVQARFKTYVLYQNQYYITLGDNLLVISQTYYTNEQKEIMENFMQNIVYTIQA
jgi:hypothetical protein